MIEIEKYHKNVMKKDQQVTVEKVDHESCTYSLIEKLLYLFLHE